MNPILKFYELLYKQYGNLNWWPAKTPFEVMIGAILTQNTTWKNVERAIENIHNAKIRDPETLLKTPVNILGQLIKPSGYYNQKAKKLLNLSRWLVEKNYEDGDLLESISTEGLREELLSISGIGKETADDILLYAFDRLVFVVDAYTFRIAIRHGWAPLDANYEELAELFSSSIPKNITIYKNFHAVIVEVGKTFCKKKSPLCADCPGRSLLEDGAPLEIN